MAADLGFVEAEGRDSREKTVSLSLLGNFFNLTSLLYKINIFVSY